MQILIVVAIIAALFAVYHFHLLATVKAALYKSKDASTGAVTAPGSVIAPPAPVVPPVDHGATPPANAGATGTQTGAVPGGDTPDANGAIAIPAIAAKFAPGSRFLTVAALPYVPVGSAQAFCIAANCGNTAFIEQISGLASVVALAVVANPAETVAVGGPAYHLAGQAPGEQRAVLANVISLSSKFASVTDIVAAYKDKPDYTSNPSNGSGFGPKH